MRWFDRAHAAAWRPAAAAALIAVAAAIIAVAAAGPPAWAVAQVPGPIEIGPSWGQLNPDGSASLYTTIVNHGVLSDRLRGGTCSGFGDAALSGLDPATQGSAADEKGVLLGPNATAILKPDGARLTLTDASRAETPGALISCTLSFVHSGQRIVVFRIGNPGPPVQEP